MIQSIDTKIPYESYNNIVTRNFQKPEKANSVSNKRNLRNYQPIRSKKGKRKTSHDKKLVNKHKYDSYKSNISNLRGRY